MAKKVVKQVPFSDNVVKLIYEDGTFGLKSTAEGQDVPETDVMDIAASDLERQQAIQESNPMLKKYAEQLRSKYPNTVIEELPKRDPRQEFLELKPKFEKTFYDSGIKDIDAMENLKNETLDISLDRKKGPPNMQDYIETMKSWIEEKKDK